MNWEQLLTSQIDPNGPTLGDQITAQLGLPAGHVLPAMGEKALMAALMTLCAAPDRHLLLPSGGLDSIAHSLGLATVTYERGPDLALDVAALLPFTIDPHLAQTWISSPDLCTGMALTPSQLHLLLTDGNGLVVVDNRYAMLSEQDYTPFIGHPRLILIQGLPVPPWSQIELFWLAAAPELLAPLRPHLAMPHWLERALSQLPWPEMTALAEGLIEKRQRLYLSLLGKGASPLLSEGPFLLAQGTASVPAHDAPGLPGFQRIDLA